VIDDFHAFGTADVMALKPNVDFLEYPPSLRVKVIVFPFTDTASQSSQVTLARERSAPASSTNETTKAFASQCPTALNSN